MVAGLALSTAALAVLGAGETAAAADLGADASLYERLGGIFAIAAVVDYFSDAVIKNPKVG